MATPDDDGHDDGHHDGHDRGQDHGPHDVARRQRSRRRRDSPALETVLLASTACLLAAVAWPIATGSRARDPENIVADPQLAAPNSGGSVPAMQLPTPSQRAPTIQIALLLDTSSSMDGLIDQARSRLWSVVNALDGATFHGATPRLEVAIYEYGNDGIAFANGHIRQVVGFTPELDRVSQALFALSTNGGSEFAPQAITRSLDELAWRDGEGVLRMVYVAGNEEFQQGPVAWTDAVDRARARGVVVNSIYCGPDGAGDDVGWAQAATRAGGRHFNIDHNTRAVDPPTPYDDEIGRLGVAINGTYVGYGNEGALGVMNQSEQDSNSVAVGSAVVRGLSKSMSNYRNPSWDLVDGVAEGVVDLQTIVPDALPEALRGLDAAELAAFVASRRAERAAIAARLTELREQRDGFLRQHAGETPSNSLDGAMIEGMAAQAEAAGFTMRHS